MKKCPECSSEKIVKDAFTSTVEGGKLSIAVDEHPNNLIMKSRKLSAVSVQVCGECGFVQFFAKFPAILWSAYQNQQNNI
jgi:predicted RNA-binding Zn-ribbon protein involved in translation (DUF1610 family)